MEILIVTVPSEQASDLEAMRHYVLESLKIGVLVLTCGMKWNLAQIPEIGGGEVAAGHPSGGLVQTQPNGGLGGGPGSRLKRQVHERLVQYRGAHGLGCFRRVAEAGGLTEHDVREAYAGSKLPLEIWRQIGKVLTALESEEPDEAD